MLREGKSGTQKIIGYSKTRTEGIKILSEYNATPYSTVNKDMTFQDLWELFLKKRGGKLGEGTLHSLKAVVRYCSLVTDFNFVDIKACHMQDCIDGCGHGYATQSAIKNLFYHLDRFAIELDLCTTNFSSILTTAPVTESEKEVFTEEERKKLWENCTLPWVDSVLIFLYTGLRISELLEIKKENVDLVAGTIKGGKKTKSGKNRVIPIHSKILPLIVKRMNTDGEFLISHNGKATTESNYRKNWKKLMATLGMKHTPHECRHTFCSLLDSAGANKVCIDRLMGHKSGNVGERVYPHKTIEELRKNLELVTN